MQILPPPGSGSKLKEYKFRLGGYGVTNLNDSSVFYYGLNNVGGYNFASLSVNVGFELGNWQNCTIEQDNNIIMMLARSKDDSSDRYWVGMDENGVLKKIVNAYDNTYSKEFSVYIKQS